MSQDDPDVDSEAETSISRRRLVAAGAAGWATVGLAGCNRLADPGTGDDGGNGNGNGNGNGGNGNGNGNGGNGNGNGNGGTGNGNGNTTVTNETTTTGDPGGETTTEGGGECESIRRFAAGMEVGLHVEVFDDYSGDVLGDDAVERVTVEFPHAEFGSLELNWEGDHEAYSPTTWGGKIVTSEDLESGTYRYEITVDDGDGDPETVVDQFTIV